MKIKILGLVAISGLAFSTVSQAENCLLDCPVSTQNGKTITRSIYTLQNNAQTKFADWIAYHITPDTISGPSRNRSWKTDPDLDAANTLEPDDYKDAYATIHTDRGHQVPLASFSNTDDWAMTNYLSNITPQSSNLNQEPWAKLENAVRSFVANGHDVYVVTGPLYENYFATLPATDKEHTIPSGYFKVVAENREDRVYASAFIMYQDAERSYNYCLSEVTVDEVESRSGISFMPLLPSNDNFEVKGSVGGLSSELGCN